MKKVLSLLVLLAALFAFVGCQASTTTTTAATTTTTTATTTTTTTTTTEEVCEVDLNGACTYNDGTTEWEEDAVVVVGVDTLVLAQGIEAAWDAAHPTMAGWVDAVVYEASDSETSGVTGVVTMQGEAPDIVLIIGSGSVGREVNFLDVSSYFEDLIANELLVSALEAVNSGDKVHYFPGVYDGMAFAWNKTMLEYLIAEEQLDITLADANSDNLPDAFDTWEEIFALADGLTARMTYVYTKDGDANPTTQTIKELFPLDLDQEWANYFSYTTGGWQLFPDDVYTEPGFDSDEFLAGLTFLTDFASHSMSYQADGVTKLAAASMGWRWDNFLKNEYPFALVGTWMDVDGNENTYNSDFQFSPMPTYDGLILTPIVKTKGFAINAYTDCPGAAVEVLRFLYSEDGLAAISDNSSYLLALAVDSTLYPATLSENKVQFAKALAYGHQECAALLPLSSSVLAVNVLYNSGITAAQRAVYDGTMTPLAAQTSIVTTAAAWILANNVAE